MPLETRRILIYCKTYPELSTKHTETVCTAGVDVHSGAPIRLYPVPLRYLPRQMQYGLYDVVDVRAERNWKDPRPESHKIDPRFIRRVYEVGTEHAWGARRDLIFADRSWHYDCLEQLKTRQAASGHSLGLVPVAEVRRIEIAKRTADEYREYERHIALQRRKLDLFVTGAERRHLDFLPFRVRLHWRCGSAGSVAPGCPGHSASVMDWGLLELGRRDGAEVAAARMREIADLERHDLRLFVGNLFTRQHVFGIVGLWYPPRHGWAHQGSLWIAS